MYLGVIGLVALPRLVCGIAMVQQAGGAVGDTELSHRAAQPHALPRQTRGDLGNMSLADLMQEILREEGDHTRYFSLLGLNALRD